MFAATMTSRLRRRARRIVARACQLPPSATPQAAKSEAMEVQVNLDTFRGPLDLLLFLVKRHEVDIFDIPIGKITDQFVEYLNTLRQVDVELAGDFLVMSATLMEIKS